MQYKFCSKCGSRIDAQARFCPGCGAAAGQEQNVQGSAPNFGYTNQNTSYYTQSSPQPTKKGYSPTGEKTPFYCPECASQSVICVKSSSDSGAKKSYDGYAFKKMKYSGCACDLACSECGASFPSQEAWSKMLGLRRVQLKATIIYGVIIIVLAILLFIIGAIYGHGAFFVIGAFMIIGSVFLFIEGIIVNSKIKSDEREFGIYGRKINGINAGSK